MNRPEKKRNRAATGKPARPPREAPQRDQAEKARIRARQRYLERRTNWTKRDAAAAREATRRYRERLKKDPVRYRAAIERRRESQRMWYAANRNAILVRKRRYTDKHRQEIYARNRAYYRKNRAKIMATRKATFLRDPEGNRRRQREWARERYERNPRRHLTYMKAWRAANPERARAYVRLSNHRRRATAGGDFIKVEDWQRLLKSFRGRCAYCKQKSDRIEADHRIPLSRGGRNTIANIVPACRRCNRRKRTKTDTEYRAWLKKVG